MEIYADLHEVRDIGSWDFYSRNLLAELRMSRLCLTVFLNHAAHLIFHLKFLLLDIDFFQLVVIRHTGTVVQFTQP